MRGLTSREVLSVWELGMHESPVRRGLMLLAPVCSGETWQSLASLPIGERDAKLLELRERTLGPHISSLAKCPDCSELVEANFETEDIRTPREMVKPPGELNHAGLTVQLRFPDSRDLEAVCRAPDAGAARRDLIARCIVKIHEPDIGSTCAANVSEEVATLVADQIASADPQADVQLALDCPACRCQWHAPFDIAEFFWTELQAYARRLLIEVHELAVAYGWAETEILSLSAARRAAYLGLVRG